MLFKELREKLEIQPTAFKKYQVDGIRIVMYKEENSYTVMIDDILLDEEFENILDAEAAVKEFLELVETEEIKEAVGDTTVEDGVNAYVTAVNAEMMKGEFSKQYKAKQEELKARAANKYWRLEIFEFGKARSIHAFVDKETGDIYKPAGWKAPAKGSRGNITDPSYISRVSQTRHPQMGGHLYKTARGGRGR